MRILLLLDHYRENETGMLVYRLCQRWAPMRKVALFTAAFGEHGPLAERLRALGVGTQAIPFDGLREVSKVREAARRVLLTADRPDVVQSHCRWPDLAARVFRSVAPHVPLVTSVHHVDEHPKGDWLPGFMTGLADRMLRKNLSVIVPNSSSIRRRLQTAGIDTARMRTIPMGIDAVQTFPLSAESREKFRILMNVPEGAPMLVYTGRDNREVQDDVLRLLQAFALLLKEFPAARLFLVGDHLRRPPIQGEIDGAALRERVRIIGDVTEVMTKIYGAADIVLRTTSPATFAFGVAEAQASGTPTIAFVREAKGDFRRDPESNQLLPVDENDILSRAVLLPHASQEKDPATLLEALRELLTDEEGRKTLGEQAREFITERYELAETANAFMELWKELAPEAMWKETGRISSEEIEEFRKAAAGNVGT